MYYVIDKVNKTVMVITSIGESCTAVVESYCAWKGIPFTNIRWVSYGLPKYAQKFELLEPRTVTERELDDGFNWDLNRRKSTFFFEKKGK